MHRTYQESIEPMVLDMKQKLLAKEDEKLHWSACSIQGLLNMLKAEVIEVTEAFDNCDPEEVMAEVVDVANFCMMIHDNLRTRKSNRETECSNESTDSK